MPLTPDASGDLEQFDLSPSRRVFISYSHDSETHQDAVLRFANRLRASGLDAVIDQSNPAPPEGWALWADRDIGEAEFVLVVCTAVVCASSSLSPALHADERELAQSS